MTTGTLPDYFILCFSSMDTRTDIPTGAPTTITTTSTTTKSPNSGSGSNSRSGKSSSSGHNLRVQATNDDSIVSKRSAVRAGYVDDPFLRYFVAKPSQRSALINRGYYLRMAAVRHFIGEFVKANRNPQVVSVGAGFDTTFFVLAKHVRVFYYMHDLEYQEETQHVRYFEADFEELIKKKTGIIETTEALHSLIKVQQNS